jgi:hypothetical protein
LAIVKLKIFKMNKDFSHFRKKCLPSMLLVLAIVLQMQRMSAQNGMLNKIKNIDFYYENASPLIWNAQGDTAIKIDFIYDYERGSLNRQSTHFNFKIEADPETKLNLILSGFKNIYNGRINSSYGRIPNQNISCYFSEDYINWESVEATPVNENNFDLQVKYTMRTGSIYVAKLPVYSVTHLENFKKSISSNALVKFIPIGHTVENRALEIIRVGNPKAPKKILLRARAHAWEPGGNWVIEGLVNSFIKTSKKTDKLLNKFCYYILPLANKDMTFRGMTRFNVNGMDLNRGWGTLADSTLNPENYFLEFFLMKLIAENNKPDLLIDFHNDDYGNIHVSKPKENDPYYLENMERIYQLLKDNTWFSGEMQNVYTGDPERYSIAADLYERYNITGFVFELNGDRIEKLKKMPSSYDWQELGEKMNVVFDKYFD